MSTEKIDIVFKDIHYSVYDTKKKEMKPILKGVSGQVKSGECLALMGASGAGKSTLLNILAGRIKNTKKTQLTGQILYNGKEYDLSKVSSFSGYVLQTDILLEFLTVKETLQFGARLKIKGDRAKKDKRVDDLISEFKLEGTENTYIGGQFLKGISGGQRKRVNICLELISDPPVIFLDEPTSGLDSYTSEIVVNKLNELAQKFNKTIIYVIHQPSSDIFRKMDKLMLLYKGKTIYFGKAGLPSVDYFGKLGFECDKNTNPSDFFMYIMQSKIDGLEKFLTESYVKNGVVKLDSNRSDKIKIDQNDFPGVGTQLASLFSRSVKMTIRNPAQTVIRFVQVLGMCFFFCSIYFQLSDDTTDPTSIFNRNGALFFLAVSNFIPPMMAQLITFPAERKVFVKEYKSRFYGVFPYYMAKSLIEIPFSLIFPLMYVFICYWIVGFNSNEFGRVLQQALTAIVLTFTATGLGILIGCVFNDLEVALNITPLIFFPMMLFSGFYVNSNSVQAWVKWIEYASPIRYALESFIYTEFEDTKFVPSPITSLGFDFGYWNAMLYLTIIGFGVRVLGYFALLINIWTS